MTINSFLIHWRLHRAVSALRRGGIIAYPTEAVYGLGCDPFNDAAVLRLLRLKQRPITKGLILIAAHWEQIQPLVNIESVSQELLTKVWSTWPGPITWVFPASNKAPTWITGNRDSIAVRVTNHALTRQLCQTWGGPLVSTSANKEGDAPATTQCMLKLYFAGQLDYILSGKLGGLVKPTEIREVITNAILRN